MLQQYCVRRKYIIRRVLAAEFNDQMIQDAMAVILFPSLQHSGREPLDRLRSEPIDSHILAWARSQLPNPLKDKNDHLLDQLNKLHSRILFLAEDYITKATATIPTWAFVFLPDIRQSSAEGCLMFKGVKVAARFNFGNLTFLERRRFVQAFLTYELLCKAENICYFPCRIPKRKVSNAEWEAVGCIQSYFCSLYGGLFAQCTDAELPSLSTEPSFPDTFYFEANRYTPKLGLDLTDLPELRQDPEFELCRSWPSVEYTDCVAHFSALGLDYLINFLHYDMTEAVGRGDLRVQLQDTWSNNCRFGGGSWEYLFDNFFESEREFKDECDSLMYKELCLSLRSSLRLFSYEISYERPRRQTFETKLRYKIGQQRAWVFFDDNYFYPQETSKRPNFPSVDFLKNEPKEEYVRKFSEDYRRGLHPWQSEQYHMREA
ncbi:hypothetical protein NW768_011640 [Fusarium equiseti]|uniref:Uncharacterized protein n=1 Tax=Fusarium equiseti TaxID=61235 RepID=A0ABQ8QX90_FUSEQ|nr:hypothetical protein NW768_011640 [Fusarium equiseti]